MEFIFKNQARTTLAAGLSNVATTMTLVSDAGFPAPTTDNPCYLRLSGLNGYELVLCTDITANVATIVRAQDDTSGLVFNPGDEVVVPVNSAVLNNFVQRSDSIAIAALDVDFKKGNIFNKAISSPETFTFSNAKQGQVAWLDITSSAGAALTLPGSVTSIVGTFKVNARNLILLVFNNAGTEQLAVIFNSDLSGGGGEVNTASNVGGFISLFKQKTGVDLEFKTVQSSDSTITVTGNTSDVDLKVNMEKIASGTDNNQTGLTYVLVLTDKDNTTVWMNNGSGNTVTIPTNASVAFPIGTKILVVQEGAGQTTLSGDTGVTVNGTSGGSVVINNQYQGAVMTKRATDTWVIQGDIT